MPVGARDSPTDEDQLISCLDDTAAWMNRNPTV